MDEKNTVKSINGIPLEDTEAREAAASKIGKEELGAAVEEALTQAKESGEFDGEPGEPGTTPHIGANGHWYIGSTDTGVKAQGEDGTPGITPHIGANGNWFLGDTDTGVQARGDDYILTEADKAEIAEEAAALVDAALLNLIGEVE